jgi:succinate dehydrogenase cytochrome b subunit
LTSLVLTVSETLRYRGALGQWSWVLHRITGLGVLFFLVLHVIDTSWAVFYPSEYVRAIAEYQSPLFTIGEFALVAAVVYHGLNGLRIAIFDFRPEWWKHQSKAAVAVLAGSVLILLPVFAIMGKAAIDHYNEPNLQVLPVVDVIVNQARFLVGIGVALVAGLLLSAIYQVISGVGRNSTATKPRASKIERFWWSYMRISGILIVPLVFGHLAMMHLIEGVFQITLQNAVPVGTTLQNFSGTSVEFVADRWGTLVAGVAIWRLYDAGMLALVVAHGFNGLRYVLTDYAHSAVIKRGLVYMTLIGAVVLIVLGGAALLVGVNDQAITLARQAIANLHP